MERIMNNKDKVFVGIYAASITIFVLYIAFASSEQCEIFQSCSYLSVKLEKDKQGVFCIVENTSSLESFYIYNMNCEEILKCSKPEIIQLYDLLQQVFTNQSVLLNESSPTGKSNCYTEYIRDTTSICFDSGKLLSSIQIFNKVYMNPQEVYHLFMYLRLFVK